jgi:hypothetical protein
MSTLYNVSVRSIEDDTTAVLDVKVVHPDSMYISATPGFALMLLWEASEAGEGGDPLATEVDLETALDAAWMRKYARGFVRGVEIVELQNEPPAAAEGDYDHTYWKEPDGWLYGAIRVEVSDPAWISHLSAGKSWDSAAFESNSTFDDCDPIQYEPADAAPAASDDPHAGLIPIPRLFFLDYLSALEEDFAWFPKYSDKAYVTDEVYEGEEITDELLDSLVGEVVLYSSYSDTLGVLLPNRNVAYFSKGSHGSAGVGPGRGTIARAHFDPSKKRLADPLTISRLASQANPAVVAAEVDGATARLTVYAFDAGRELALQHEAEALSLIATPECESFHRFANATSPLGSLLHAMSQEHGITFENELYTKVCKGIIVDSTVQKTADGEQVDFDSLSDDELIAKLAENPWDTWTIEITASDPAFVEHLPSVTPYSYGFYWVGDPQPWEGEPLTAGV